MSLYRTIMRGIGHVADPTTRVESHRHVRAEFERHRHVTDIVRPLLSMSWPASWAALTLTVSHPLSLVHRPDRMGEHGEVYSGYVAVQQKKNVPAHWPPMVYPSLPVPSPNPSFLSVSHRRSIHGPLVYQDNSTALFVAVPMRRVCSVQNLRIVSRGRVPSAQFESTIRRLYPCRCLCLGFALQIMYKWPLCRFPAFLRTT